jgi:hypothetical protein
MPSVTHSHFNVETEGLEVAKAFADGIRGKTVIVTGGNRSGIGFATARSFVCVKWPLLHPVLPEE